MLSATLFLLLDQCGWGRGGGASLFLLDFLLPFKGTRPILVLVFIEFCFPSANWLLAGGACVVLGVASHTIAMLNVVEELALKFACYQLAVDSGGQIGSLEAGRERGG